jgi:hypothetical protein
MSNVMRHVSYLILIKCGRIELSRIYPANPLESSDLAIHSDETVEFLPYRHCLAQKRLKLVQIMFVSQE